MNKILCYYDKNKDFITYRKPDQKLQPWVHKPKYITSGTVEEGMVEKIKCDKIEEVK